MSEKNERRKYSRVKNKFNVKINKKSDGKIETSLKVGKVSNISASGILLTHDQSFEIGTIVNVNFLKPNSFEIFNSDGTLVRVDENFDGTYDLAIEFFGLSEEDMKTLDYLLAK